jgi:murein DD-endopeptidase MepM/ murein hydrolase activator NlpD
VPGDQVGESAGVVVPVVECRHVLEALAAGGEEAGSILDGDLVEGLEGVDREAGTGGDRALLALFGSQRWINPTGQAIRGCDTHGCGSFGAPRKNATGSHPHRGLDFVGTPGQDVRAVATGRVRVGRPYADDPMLRYVQIATPDGYTIRELYVKPLSELAVGDVVIAGDIIGTLQSLQHRYPGITDHVHVETSVGGPIREGGLAVDPSSIFAQ